VRRRCRLHDSRSWLPNLGGTGVASLFRQLAVIRDGEAVVYVIQNRTEAIPSPSSGSMPRVPVEIEGSQFMLNPQISPDGRWLIGWAAALSGSDRAYRIPVSGGTPEPLPLEVRSQQAAWDSKGNFWFTQTPGGRGIARLTPDGKVGAELAAKTVGLLLQQILPVTSMP
jgi:hypothetical protein